MIYLIHPCVLCSVRHIEYTKLDVLARMLCDDVWIKSVSHLVSF